MAGEQSCGGAGAVSAAAGIIGAVVLLLNAGCGSARSVLVEPGGGIVAVPGNTESLRAEALQIIGGHCPSGYEITREEEVPVGSRVRGETRTRRDVFDDITTTEKYSVRNKYEWWIHYRCL